MILFGPVLFSKATTVEKFFLLFFMQSFSFGTKSVCRIVISEITHPPPSQSLLKMKWMAPYFSIIAWMYVYP